MTYSGSSWPFFTDRLLTPMTAAAVHPIPPIPTAQNLPHNANRLLAQRHLYTVAKRLSTLQLLMAGATTLVGALAVSLSTSADPWIALAGILVPLINIGCLESWQDRFRRAAAVMQEDFDCNVLALPWNQVLAGDRPSAEDVHEANRRAASRSDTPIHDWYPAILSAVPIHQARVICQRTNCRWDSRLRRRYGLGILVALACISGLGFLLAFLSDMNLQKFVLAVAAPLFPTLLWGIREVRRQNAAAARLDRLGTLFDICWRAVADDELVGLEATRRSRELQDGLLLHRQTSPLVFDWVYRHGRGQYEEQQKAAASALVAQVRRPS